jgi:hypothetical protein
MNIIPKDYSYIARAGQQIQQGVQDVGRAMDKDIAEKAKTVDRNQFDNEIYPQQIETAVQLAKEAGMDDVSAHALAVRYFPNLNSMDPPEKIKLFNENDASFRKEIEKQSLKILQQKSAGTPAVPEQPGQQINLEGQRAQSSVQTPYTTPATTVPIASPEAARSARLAGSSQPTSMMKEGLLPGDEPQTAQMPPTPAQPAQQANANDLRSEADKMGLSGNAQADAIVNRAYNTQFNLPAGSRAQAMAETLNKQGGFTPETKATLEQVQTDQQIANNKRLEESATLKDKAAKAHNDVEKAKLRLTGKKLDQQTKAFVFAKQAEAKKDMLDAQLKVKALEGALTRANKDITGGIDKGEYDTQMKELQDQYEAAATYEETIAGYQEILDGTLSNTLPGGPNVKPNQPAKPASLTPAKSQYKDPLGIR